MKKKSALIMVDLQNDFCKGGALEVPAGDEVISLANQLQNHFDLVIATKDWHPEEHISFATRYNKKVGDVVKAGGIEQILWPQHCVQQKKGSEFHPELDTTKIDKIILKGLHKEIDSYSAFFDNAQMQSTGLETYLRENGIQDIYVMGLATDYCVKYTCIDAAKLGFNVYLIEDACRGVEIKPGDIEAALREMKAAGVIVVKSSFIELHSNC